jgi:hypothetical protein
MTTRGRPDRRRTVNPIKTVTPIKKGNTMHPYMHEQLIRAQRDNLGRHVARARAESVPRRSHVRDPLRRNVGWLLINVGRRLAPDQPATWPETGQQHC